VSKLQTFYKSCISLFKPTVVSIEILLFQKCNHYLRLFLKKSLIAGTYTIVLLIVKIWFIWLVFISDYEPGQINCVFSMNGLIDWCLTPTLVVFQLYRGVNKFFQNNFHFYHTLRLWFQQYFSYIVEASFIGGGNRRTRGENTRPVASHWQTLSHNVVLSTPGHERG
jgi:hypothetical protein